MDRLSDNEFTHINSVLARKTLNNVNAQRYNVDKKSLNNVNNVKSDRDEALEKLLELYEDKPRGIAEIIAEELDDTENLNFYIKVAKQNDPHPLFEALAITQGAQREGKIKGSPPKYYVGVLKRKGVHW